MKERTWQKNWCLRMALVVILFGIGYYMLMRAQNGFSDLPLLALGFLFMLLGAVTLARPIASRCADAFISLLLPTRRFNRKQPMYGIPESKRKNGFAQEAFDGFKKITEEYPQEVKAYILLIDVAVVDLKNTALAESVYAQGLATLRKPEAKTALTRMYEGIRTRITSAYDETPKVLPYS